MNLIFATNNAHKIEEARQIVGARLRLVTLREAGIGDEIVEDADTLEGNALIKARFVHRRTGGDCFADDTGLEVAALNGAPGVWSARYAGPGCDSAANIAKLLGELGGVADRRARFRTVIALILDGREYLFEGEVRGEITENPSGTDGFGYDPVFRPEGFPDTFARMSAADKNAISHRGRAIRAMAQWLASGQGEALR